jgi:glycosyltransferase involved in cell wall biosynthesis
MHINYSRGEKLLVSDVIMNGPHLILFITANLKGGGAERALVNILNHLDRSRFEPHLALFQKEGVFLSELAADVPIYEIQPTDHGFLHRNRVRLFEIKQLITKTKPALIMSVLWQANAVASFAVRMWGRSIPLVINEQTSPNASLRTDPRRKHLWPIVRRLYRHADCAIAISQGIANELESYGIPTTNTVVIHNPIPIAAVRESANVVSSAKFEARPAIVAAGRLVPLKNYPLLLTALSYVLEKEPVHLYILGKGPERTQIETLAKSLGIAEHVHLLGFQSNPYPYFAQADLFVLSSNHEGFGNVLVEAMVLGVPVIATDCPHGPREILDGGKYGSLVPLGNANALSKAILSLLHQPDKRARFAIQGPERAKEFSVEAIIPQYEKLFMGLIKRQSG